MPSGGRRMKLHERFGRTAGASPDSPRAGMDVDDRFNDRLDAGERLARRLGRYARQPDVIVLALPRGGVPVGFAIARRLGLALDVLVVRKLGMPHQPERAMGAIGPGGVRVLQAGVPGPMGVNAAEVDAVTARELAELARRERAYRGNRAPADLAGRRAILVDDGVATGSTMLAAIDVARRLGAAQVILAIPVAPPETVDMLASRADMLVCLMRPARFRSVGYWYADFEQTGDDEVQRLLACARHPPAGRFDECSDSPGGGPDHATIDDGHKS